MYVVHTAAVGDHSYTCYSHYGALMSVIARKVLSLGRVICSSLSREGVRGRETVLAAHGGRHLVATGRFLSERIQGWHAVGQEFGQRRPATAGVERTETLLAPAFGVQATSAGAEGEYRGRQLTIRRGAFRAEPGRCVHRQREAGYPEKNCRDFEVECGAARCSGAVE